MKSSQVVFIGVKPHLVLHVLKEIYDNISGDHVVVSVANGITTQVFEQVVHVFNIRAVIHITL